MFVQKSSSTRDLIFCGGTSFLWLPLPAAVFPPSRGRSSLRSQLGPVPRLRSPLLVHYTVHHIGKERLWCSVKLGQIFKKRSCEFEWKKCCFKISRFTRFGVLSLLALSSWLSDDLVLTQFIFIPSRDKDFFPDENAVYAPSG